MVREWAWRMYDKTATKKQRKLREKERKHPNEFLQMTLDWSRMKAAHKTTWYESATSSGPAHLVCPSPTIVPDVPESPVSRIPGKTCIFETEYVNDTATAHTYHVKTARTTRSYCMAEVRRGGVIRERGAAGAVASSPVQMLSPPKPARQGDGYTATMSLPGVEGGVMEYEQDWSVREKVIVPAHQMMMAQVLTDEKTMNGEFTVLTELSGAVNVIFTDIQDNNSFMKGMSGDITSITEDFLDHRRAHSHHSWDFVETRRHGNNSVVLVTTEGTCSFRFNTNPHVTLQFAAI